MYSGPPVCLRGVFGEGHLPALGCLWVKGGLGWAAGGSPVWWQGSWPGHCLVARGGSLGLAAASAGRRVDSPVPALSSICNTLSTPGLISRCEPRRLVTGPPAGKGQRGPSTSAFRQQHLAPPPHTLLDARGPLTLNSFEALSLPMRPPGVAVRAPLLWAQGWRVATLPGWVPPLLISRRPFRPHSHSAGSWSMALRVNECTSFLVSLSLGSVFSLCIAGEGAVHTG